MVIEDRLDALLPLAALVRERVPQPHPRAQIEEMVRRDPRLGQPSDHQQLAHVARIGAVALGALLVPTPGSGLSRLRQMHDRANTSQLLGHEAPAGRRLQPDLELLTTEPLHELRTPARSAGEILDRETSPVSVSITLR